MQYAEFVQNMIRLEREREKEGWRYCEANRHWRGFVAYYSFFFLLRLLFCFLWKRRSSSTILSPYQGYLPIADEDLIVLGSALRSTIREHALVDVMRSMSSVICAIRYVLCAWIRKRTRHRRTCVFQRKLALRRHFLLFLSFYIYFFLFLFLLFLSSFFFK